MSSPRLTGLAGSTRRHRLRRALPVLLGLYLLAGSTGARSTETVQALRYGVTLFHYYQQDYFAALTELMAAQQLHQLAPHADNAELLRGGISLSYGMDRVAQEIFQQLLSGTADAPDRDQAWFYLAKITWQRGQPERAKAALAQMSTTYQGSLKDEADYLRAAISLQQGDALHAATLMESLPPDSPWRYYLGYNLGAAETASHNWAGAVAYFRPLDVLRGGTAESKALRDRALTASGYALLAAGEYRQAGGEFTRVRLEGPMAERALLGYGWASLEEGEYLAALSPWQALGERSLLNESVRESLLAIPYAYEKLGKPGTALARYQGAADRYAAELSKVRAAADQFRTGPLAPLLGLEAEAERQQWLFDGDILPLGDFAPYLRHLLTRHRFQLAMRELRDLYSMAWHLAEAQRRLAVLAQVDADQLQTWSGLANSDRQVRLQQRRAALQQRVEQLREQFNAAAIGADTRALAAPEQAARWARLEHAERLADTIDAQPEQRELLRLYRGLLLWQDNEDFPAQSWRAKGELEELELLTAASGRGIQAVLQASVARRRDGFAPRIEALGQRVAAASIRVRDATSRAESRIRQLAVAELEAQAQQLVSSIGQSRLAVARLYDQGSPEVPR